MTRLVGDRLNTEARQVWEVFARVAPRFANSLEAAPSVVRSRGRKLLQIETIPIGGAGFLLVKKSAPSDPVARLQMMLSAKARNAAAAAAANFVEGVAAVWQVVAQFDKGVNSSDQFGLFVFFEALISAIKYRRRASIAISWRRDAPDRLLVEAADGGSSLTWRCS